MGWTAGDQNIIFYADDGRIAGRDPEWLQESLLATVSMFCRVGLAKNLDKTKFMVCMPGFIWVQLGKEAYKRRAMGEGVTFQERTRTQVSCAECRSLVTDSYLNHHMELLHGTSLPHTRRINMGGGRPTTYVVYLPRVLETVDFLVQGCPAVAHIARRLQGYFMYGYFRSKVAVF